MSMKFLDVVFTSLNWCHKNCWTVSIFYIIKYVNLLCLPDMALLHPTICLSKIYYIAENGKV